ncbi:MAG: hypothetical protein M1347_08590 [Chloroflexi bacterium]|nr:hypothetical protein [Chloroflexota bacterium]
MKSRNYTLWYLAASYVAEENIERNKTLTGVHRYWQCYAAASQARFGFKVQSMLESHSQEASPDFQQAVIRKTAREGSLGFFGSSSWMLSFVAASEWQTKDKSMQSKSVRGNFSTLSEVAVSTWAK